MHRDTAPESIWSTFYQEQHPPDQLNADFSPKNSIPSLASDYFIYKCIFHGFTDGCLNHNSNYNDNPAKILISTCFFYENTRTGTSSCLYVKGKCHIVQHRFCAYQCIMNIDYLGVGHYCYVEVPEYGDDLNYLIEGSISQCGKLNDAYITQDGVAVLVYGLISISKSNFSKSSSWTSAGYNIFEPTSNQSYFSNVNLTNVDNNTATYSMIQYDSHGYCRQKMLNFINNKIESDIDYHIGHIISGLNSFNIDYCCFKNNKGNAKLFKNLHYHFFVSDCFIDNFTSSGLVSSANIIIDSSSFIFDFFETGLCFNPKPKHQEITCYDRRSYKYLLDISLSIIINRSN